MFKRIDFINRNIGIGVVSCVITGTTGLIGKRIIRGGEGGRQYRHYQNDIAFIDLNKYTAKAHTRITAAREVNRDSLADIVAHMPGEWYERRRAFLTMMPSFVFSIHLNPSQEQL